MSACAECLASSIERSRLVGALESSGVPTAMAAQLLELTPIEALARLSSEGISPAQEGVGQRAAGGMWTVCRHEPEFPAQLTYFRRESDIPHVLYGLGQKRHFDEMPSRRAVALVGARRASAYGREVSYSLAMEAASAGLTVVSGMALGIDGAAHRGALQGGGPTVAVLAGGVDKPYPRSHRLLYEQILERGCVVSESPPGVEARRWSFVARNRIIAGLASLTVFVEGGESSGARHTLRFAEELESKCGVVPGPITSPMSAGPNSRLADDNVIPVLGIDDVKRALELRFSDRMPASVQDDDGGEFARLMTAIASGARDPRAIAAELPEMSARQITRLLGELELRGQLRRTPSGEYERTA